MVLAVGLESFARLDFTDDTVLFWCLALVVDRFWVLPRHRSFSAAPIGPCGADGLGTGRCERNSRLLALASNTNMVALTALHILRLPVELVLHDAYLHHLVPRSMT